MALHHAKSGEIVDLRPIGHELKHAKTAAIVKSETFEVVRLIVHAGVTIPPHRVSGAVTLHCLEGRVVIGLADADLVLSAGQWVYFDGGASHSVKGVEDSSVLLTILL